MWVQRFLQQIVSVVAGVIGLLVAVWVWLPADLTNHFLPATDMQRLQISVAVILSITSAAFLNYFFVDRDNKRNAETLGKVEKHLEIIHSNEALVGEIRVRLRRLPPSGRRLTQYVGGYIVDRIETMLTSEYFEIQNGQVFQNFYRETFKALRPPCDIVATANPTRQYMWSAQDLNELFSNFIKRGGSLTRVFFLKDESELASEELQAIMQGQAAAGVRVGWILISKLDQPRLMIADKQKTLSWELWTHFGTGQIDKLNASWNVQTCDERWRYLQLVTSNATWYAPQ